MKALSERLKSTETSRHNQIPKSFPPVAGGVSQGHAHGHSHSQHQHKHHGHHGGQSHHHHLGGSHSHGAHSSSASHGHAHSHASSGHGELQTPPFLKQSVNSASTLPITTARSEPRMISTMSSIAIPMPAPPPKAENSAIATSDFNDESSEKVLLINMDNDNTQ